MPILDETYAYLGSAGFRDLQDLVPGAMIAGKASVVLLGRIKDASIRAGLMSVDSARR